MDLLGTLHCFDASYILLRHYTISTVTITNKLIYDYIMCVTGDPMMSSMKPAPLQFVKLAPSDLYRTAQDQLDKTAVVVKQKPKEFDAEWQSVNGFDFYCYFYKL